MLHLLLFLIFDLEVLPKDRFELLRDAFVFADRFRPDAPPHLIIDCDRRPGYVVPVIRRGHLSAHRSDARIAARFGSRPERDCRPRFVLVVCRYCCSGIRIYCNVTPLDWSIASYNKPCCSLCILPVAYLSIQLIKERHCIFY